MVENIYPWFVNGWWLVFLVHDKFEAGMCDLWLVAVVCDRLAAGVRSL